MKWLGYFFSLLVLGVSIDLVAADQQVLASLKKSSSNSGSSSSAAGSVADYADGRPVSELAALVGAAAVPRVGRALVSNSSSSAVSNSHRRQSSPPSPGMEPSAPAAVAAADTLSSDAFSLLTTLPTVDQAPSPSAPAAVAAADTSNVDALPLPAVGQAHSPMPPPSAPSIADPVPAPMPVPSAPTYSLFRGGEPTHSHSASAYAAAVAMAAVKPLSYTISTQPGQPASAAAVAAEGSAAAAAASPLRYGSPLTVLGSSSVAAKPKLPPDQYTFSFDVDVYGPKSLGENGYTCRFSSNDIKGSYEGAAIRALQAARLVVAPGTPPASPKAGKRSLNTMYEMHKGHANLQLSVTRVRWRPKQSFLPNTVAHWESDGAKSQKYSLMSGGQEKAFKEAQAFLLDPEFRKIQSSELHAKNRAAERQAVITKAAASAAVVFDSEKAKFDRDLASSLKEMNAAGVAYETKSAAAAAAAASSSAGSGPKKNGGWWETLRDLTSSVVSGSRRPQRDADSTPTNSTSNGQK